MLDTTKFSDQAFDLGREAGVKTAQHIIQGYEDGDPEIMDLEPAPLSGEWADSPTPQSLANDLDLPEAHRGTELDQLCTDYELGFSEGFWNEVIRSAKAIL